jgi:hypothetical protein
MAALNELKNKKENIMKKVDWKKTVETTKTILLTAAISGVVFYMTGYHHSQVISQEIQTKAAAMANAKSEQPSKQ